MNALNDLAVRLAPGAEVEARRNRRIVAAAFIGALLYATIRYNLFKGVPWGDWPSLIVNKAIGLTALLLVVAGVQAMVAGRSARHPLAWAGAGVLLHVAISFAILNPAYFPAWFAGGKLTVAAAVSVLTGGAAAVGMEVGARKSGGMSYRGRSAALAAIAAAAGFHAGVTGIHNWVNPQSWPGGMPPITLISCLLGFAALALALRRA